jgi:predicted O-methyltransferase YrrM
MNSKNGVLPTSGKKVLLFAPFGSWTVHHQLDAVIGAALRSRGCQVQALCCDGVFEECYIAGTPYRQEACAACQRQARQLFQAFGIPAFPIGKYLTPEDRKACAEWSAAIAPNQFESAVFENSPIGRWVALGVIAQLKKTDYDTSNPDVTKTIRLLLCNAALLTRTFTRYLQEFKPDHTINYSGDHVYYRIAFELCRKSKINVLTHERGQINDSFALLNNVTINSAWTDGIEEWQNWQGTPLSGEQFSTIQSHIEGLEQSKNNNFQTIYETKSDDRNLRKQLHIPPDATVLAIFTSNEWELGTFQASQGIKLIFKNQIEWIQKTADICARHGWYLVVRHHPICAGTKTYPRDSLFLSKIIAMNRNCGPHVRVIMPAEKITSYAVVWNCDAALTCYSTIGMEAFMRGIDTVHLADTLYEPMGLKTVRKLEDYEPAIVAAIERTRAFNIENLRNAYRFAYFRFFIAYSHRFKAFGIRNTYDADIRIGHIDELAPGNDPVLDRVCDHIMHGTPLYTLPDGNDYSDQENRCLQAELDRIRQKKADILFHLAAKTEKLAVPLAVVRVRFNGVRNRIGEPFDTALKRSWYQDYKMLQVPLITSQEPCTFLSDLQYLLQTADAQYVYITTDNIQINESLITTCVEQLNQNSEYQAVLSGCYVMAADGTLRDEVLTALRPIEAFDSLLQSSPLFSNPAVLLSLLLMRKDFLLNLVEKLRPEKIATSSELARRIFGEVHACPDALLRLRYPLLCVHEKHTPQQALKEAMALIRSGQLDRGIGFLDEIKLTGNMVPEIQYARAAAKSKQGLLTEARLAMESVLFAGRAPDAMWQFYDSILLEQMRTSHGFASIAPAVEKIEGYLVPGQEAFLFNKVRELPNDASILEIGGYFGRSTAAMAFACVGTKRQIYTIDTFYGNDGAMGRSESFLDVWQANLSRFDLERYATPLQGLSVQVLAELDKSQRFDFVFIDGSHEYIDIIRDLEMVYPYVKEGGWIALHDVEPGWPGPWRVWRQTARILLSDHAYETTLACGRKRPATPYFAFNETPFSYALDWADYLSSTFPRLKSLSCAMRATAKHPKPLPMVPQESPQEVDQSMTIIANMPEFLKQTLRAMLSKEASTDWLLHYWNALALHREGRSTEATTEFHEAQSLCAINQNNPLAA